MPQIERAMPRMLAGTRRNAGRPRALQQGGSQLCAPCITPLSGRPNMIRRHLGLVLIAASLAVGACNTVSGAGKDLQSASNEVKEEIKD
jgi:predicted small secreted protein